jgi:dimethylaniline monooxygenase (N-oxide forming)
MCPVLELLETKSNIPTGISGIIAAQRYLQAHPESKITILEKYNCVGGVFGKSKSH